MAVANTVSTLNGLFKNVYADKLETLIPEGVKLTNLASFVKRTQQNGSLYNQPVVLGREHGVTYSLTGDAFTLNPSISGVIKEAQVQGGQIVLRSALSYAAASRSMGGEPRAFEDATKFLVKNMMESFAYKLEMNLFYGQVGIASVASILGLVITVATADWAPGVWAGSEGMPINIRDTAGTNRGSATVVSVDMELRTVTVDAMPAGVVATDIIHVDGSFGNEAAGLHKIMTNTGTLFNISASQYNLWKSNSFAAAGALSFPKIQSAVARGVEKGLQGKVTVLVNPRGWSNLLSDQAALRMYDSSYKSAQVENGAESIKFHGQNGAIEITPSNYVKEGFAYVLADGELIRIGSTDITFRRPGQGEEFFRDLESSAGYELRAYCDQALFCSKPGHMVLIQGITNT